MISLIISVYNNIDITKYLFHNLKFQTFKDFEIIVSDDGSNDDYQKFCAEQSRYFKFPIKYVWHEDKGFRKNRILNRAIYRSSFDKLIFIDSDCVPHIKFIENHYKLLSDTNIITGRRVNIDRDLFNILSSDRPIKFSVLKLLYNKFQKKLAYPECGLYLPFKKLARKKNATLLGCNMSISKKNLLMINGFNEEYLYYGTGEDTDIQERLKMCGLKIFNFKFHLIQYHINHPLNKFSINSEININILNNTIESRNYYCYSGLDKINESDHTYIELN